jgi:hypothetical protein
VAKEHRRPVPKVNDIKVDPVDGDNSAIHYASPQQFLHSETDAKMLHSAKPFRESVRDSVEFVRTFPGSQSLKKSGHLHRIVVAGHVNDLLIADLHHPAILQIEVCSVLAHSSFSVELDTCEVTESKWGWKVRLPPSPPISSLLSMVY